MNMITRFTLCFLLVFPVLSSMGKSARTFDPAHVYAAMAGSDLKELDAVLTELDKTTIASKSAYEGALLMKKAGLLSKPKEKLQVFKSGKEKLEAAIRDNADNVEYHFLRLMIQENAPKILGYKKNIDADSKMVTSSYKTLPSFLRQAVKDYSKASRTLKTADL